MNFIIARPECYDIGDQLFDILTNAKENIVLLNIPVCRTSSNQ
jgi:hypothetical protein